MAATTLIADRAAFTLMLPGSGDFFVADGDAVWITNRGRIERLERGHASPTASVSVPAPGGVPAFGAGSVWVANLTDASIYRVDAASATVAAVMATGLADPEGELSLAFGAGSVWVPSDPAGLVSRIDPATNTIVARIQVAPGSFGLAFGFGALWVTSTHGSSVQRIDPATNAVTATIAVGPAPRFIAAGAGGVWTLNQGDGSVSRIDPATNRVIATIHVSGGAGEGGDIAAGAGRVWVRATLTLLAAIDPSMNRVVEQLDPPSGSGGVSVAGDWVWVSAHDVQRVWVLPA